MKTIVGMEVRSHWARDSFERSDADGSTKGRIHTSLLSVDVFTYAGGEHGGPFTTLETWFAGQAFYARLPRCYSRRWFSRLARDFAEVVWNRCISHADWKL